MGIDMTFRQLENFYEKHPDGPLFRSLLDGMPIKAQFKIIKAHLGLEKCRKRVELEKMWRKFVPRSDYIN
jgi:hypothetical protein